MALPDTNDPHFFYHDIEAAGEEDTAVVEYCYEAATDVEDTSSISAESNEGDFNCVLWSQKLWQTKQACASLLWFRPASGFTILPCLLIFYT